MVRYKVSIEIVPKEDGGCDFDAHEFHYVYDNMCIKSQCRDIAFWDFLDKACHKAIHEETERLKKNGGC